jgi:hypothetical protein
MRMTTYSFALALALSCFVPGVASAQAPQGLPPPSFGPNAAAGPGGAIEGYQVHRFRDWGIQVAVLVSAADLRALLPIGYSLPNPNDTIAAVTLVFLFQERTELVESMGGLSPGSYPTAQAMTALTGAVSPTGAFEFLVLTNERPTEASTNLDLAIFGPGTARHASLVKVELEAERRTRITFKGEVASGALWAKVQVTTSVATVASLRNFLSPFSFRQLDNRFQPPAASARLTTGSAADQIAVPVGKDVRLWVKNSRLKLPGGALTVVGVGGARIDRWMELFQKVSLP